MFRDFGSLALKAFPCPTTHILSHGWPHYFGTDCLSGPFHTRMAQSMNQVENSTA